MKTKTKNILIEEKPVNLLEEDNLLEIEDLNNSSKIHGILIQLPLPKHLDSKKILNSVDPMKDVDGFHYMNIN